MIHFSLIGDALQELNKASHEQSVLTTLQDDIPVPNARWVARRELSELDEIGWPIYFNADTDKILFTPLSHVLLVGSTGTGKSSVFIKNTVNLLASVREDQKPFLYISDYNGLLTSVLLPHLQSNGYEVHVYDMRNVLKSLRYNPLLKIYDDHHRALHLKEEVTREGVSHEEKQKMYREILLLEDRRDKTIDSVAHTLVPPIPSDKSPCWQDGARMMIKGGLRVMVLDSERPEISGITRDTFTIHTLIRIMTSTQDDCMSLINFLDRYSEHSNEVRIAVNSYYRISAKQTRDSYVSSCLNALAKFSSRRCRLVTSAGDMNMTEIVRDGRPHAVFVITDDRNPEMNQILAMIVQEILCTLMDEAIEQPDQRLSRPALFMLDELCNTPALETLTRSITVARGRNIHICMAIQSYEQLKRVYPNEDETIIENCDLSLLMGTNSIDSMAKYAKSFGEHTAERTSFSIGSDLSVNRSVVTETVPLLRKSDLEGLPLGMFFARHRKSGNFLTKMTPYFLRTDVDHTPAVLPDILPDPAKLLESPTFDIEEVLEKEWQEKHKRIFETRREELGRRTPLCNGDDSLAYPVGDPIDLDWKVPSGVGTGAGRSPLAAAGKDPRDEVKTRDVLRSLERDLRRESTADQGAKEPGDSEFDRFMETFMKRVNGEPVGKTPKAKANKKPTDI